MELKTWICIHIVRIRENVFKYIRTWRIQKQCELFFSLLKFPVAFVDFIYSHRILNHTHRHTHIQTITVFRLRWRFYVKNLKLKKTSSSIYFHIIYLLNRKVSFWDIMLLLVNIEGSNTMTSSQQLSCVRVWKCLYIYNRYPAYKWALSYKKRQLNRRIREGFFYFRKKFVQILTVFYENW